jgi:hypothetical protein
MKFVADYELLVRPRVAGEAKYFELFNRTVPEL